MDVNQVDVEFKKKPTTLLYRQLTALTYHTLLHVFTFSQKDKREG